MKWSRDMAGSPFDPDNGRVQLSLPFPIEKTIDMRRCRSILKVSSTVVYSLRRTPLPGAEEMCLNAYNTMPCAPLRIDYASLVRYLDHLREIYAIPDRRPPMVFGRHRDEDLLPFKWSDTMTIEEVADVMNLHRSNVLLRIEAGQFEAYKLLGTPWRISRSSVQRLIISFGANSSKEKV